MLEQVCSHLHRLQNCPLSIIYKLRKISSRKLHIILVSHVQGRRTENGTRQAERVYYDDWGKEIPSHERRLKACKTGGKDNRDGKCLFSMNTLRSQILEREKNY